MKHWTAFLPNKGLAPFKVDHILSAKKKAEDLFLEIRKINRQKNADENEVISQVMKKYSFQEIVDAQAKEIKAWQIEKLINTCELYMQRLKDTGNMKVFEEMQIEKQKLETELKNILP
jgi:hypothetical protein